MKQLIAARESNKDKIALKVIGQIENLDELGLPDLVSSYNAKPTLLTKSCNIKTGQHPFDEVLEINFDVRQWNYLTRKTFGSLKHRLAEAVVSIGFVVEGKDDAALPEQLLGGYRLNFVDFC